MPTQAPDKDNSKNSAAINRSKHAGQGKRITIFGLVRSEYGDNAARAYLYDQMERFDGNCRALARYHGLNQHTVKCWIRRFGLISEHRRLKAEHRLRVQEEKKNPPTDWQNQTRKVLRRKYQDSLYIELSSKHSSVYHSNEKENENMISEFLLLVKKDPTAARAQFVSVCEGRSNTEAIKVLGISEYTFYKLKKRFSLESKRKRVLLDDTENDSPQTVFLKKQCRELIALGWSMGDIAEFFDISRETLYNGLNGEWSNKIAKFQLAHLATPN